MGVVRDIIWLPANRQTMRDIVAKIAAIHEAAPHELRGGIFSRKLAPARQHAMWEMHARGYSNAQIAGVLGLKNHSTVVKGRQAHERRLEGGRDAT